jgi:hypothetical protein
MTMVARQLHMLQTPLLRPWTSDVSSYTTSATTAARGQITSPLISQQCAPVCPGLGVSKYPNSAWHIVVGRRSRNYNRIPGHGDYAALWLALCIVRNSRPSTARLTATWEGRSMAGLTPSPASKASRSPGTHMLGVDLGNNAPWRFLRSMSEHQFP